MKPIEGYKVTELTEDRIVQERISERGNKIIVIGNPNPDPVERQKMVDEIGEIITECIRKHKAKEQAD